jgi:hypothetical protein
MVSKRMLEISYGWVSDDYQLVHVLWMEFFRPEVRRSIVVPAFQYNHKQCTSLCTIFLRHLFVLWRCLCSSERSYARQQTPLFQGIKPCLRVANCVRVQLCEAQQRAAEAKWQEAFAHMLGLQLFLDGSDDRWLTGFPLDAISRLRYFSCQFINLSSNDVFVRVSPHASAVRVYPFVDVLASSICIRFRRRTTLYLRPVSLLVQCVVCVH